TFDRGRHSPGAVLFLSVASAPGGRGLADIHDAAAVADIHVTSWVETYTGIIPRQILDKLRVEERIALWRRVLSADSLARDTRVFVVRDKDQRIVGFGCCGRQRDQKLALEGFAGEVQAIYILRKFQRRGAGRALMTLMANYLERGGGVFG